ncbi:MAG TPA: hypothetical protein PL037_04175, partial [Elusimicrobiales bacterium]|nr:hypothetical protein [Elusimicrobiales bacterium]
EDSEATAFGVAAAAAGAVGISLPRRAEASREFAPSISAGERADLLKGWRAFVRGVRRNSATLRGLGVLPHA